MVRHGKRRDDVVSETARAGESVTDEDGDRMPELHSDSDGEGNSDSESNGPERSLFQLIEEQMMPHSQTRQQEKHQRE